MYYDHSTCMYYDHSTYMHVVHVSCPTGLMFRAIEVGGPGGDASRESSEVWGAARPLNYCTYVLHDLTFLFKYFVAFVT